MKILIISHVPLTGTYGAATSLRNHLKLLSNYPELEFTVIEQLGYHHGPKVQALCNMLRISWLLPITGNYDGYIGGYLRHIYYYFRKRIAYLFFDSLCRRIIALNPDVIHLNSLVLADLGLWLRSNKQFDNVRLMASVREVLSASLTHNEVNSIRSIDRFVCIDNATKDSLLKNAQVNSVNVLVQQNPFVISNNNWSRAREFKSRFKCIYAIAGAITEDKGVLDVVRSFLAADLNGSVLLIVGGGQGNYSNEVKKLCKNSSNIFYLGEIPDLCVSGFFNSIDVVIRGDHSFRTGRSVYEAIYSGAIAILPCVGDEYLSDNELSAVSDNVLFYIPKDLKSLEDSMRSALSLVLSGKCRNPFFNTRCDSYVEAYKNIYLNSFF